MIHKTRSRGWSGLVKGTHGWLVGLSISLTACAPFIEVMQVDPEQAQQLRSEMDILPVRSVEASEYTTVGSVSATSCKAMLWDPDASEEDATNQLLYKAAQQGADAIYDLSCSDFEGTSLSTNCWNTLTCTAIAVRRN
jgi:hypothetical protein